MFTKQWKKNLNLLDGSGTTIPAIVACKVSHWNDERFSHRQCDITLRYQASEVAGSGPDFFEAFCRVREALANVGIKPLCYGASRNVFPSGMARDMADGLKAYKLRLGSRVSSEQIVDIFDWAADVDPVSVVTQREFFDEYRRTPKT